MPRVPKEPKKKAEFAQFIKLLKGGAVSTWVQVAQALGVDPNTITAWKALPEAQQAISDGINHAITKMEETGRRDWRMWKDKAQMLGVSPVTKQDVTSAGEKLNPVEELIKAYTLREGDEPAGETEKTEGRSS